MTFSAYSGNVYGSHYFLGGQFPECRLIPPKMWKSNMQSCCTRYPAHRINALAFQHAKKCVWELFPSPIQLCFYRCDDISFFLCIHAFVGSCNEDLPTISISICLFYCLWGALPIIWISFLTIAVDLSYLQA